jgi:FixJ family two-component response regulator
MSQLQKRGIVYVVDDDEAIRDSVRWLLDGHGFWARCFDSAETFLARYDPDEIACLLVDVRMSGMSGIELQRHLVAQSSPLPLAFVTAHGDVPMAVSTMRDGAADFIQKPFKESELIQLVRQMLVRAESTFSNHRKQIERSALLARLTTREEQVLERIVAGRLNKQIADDLGISIKTVEAHRASVMDKLEANTVADLLCIVLGDVDAA